MIRVNIGPSVNLTDDEIREKALHANVGNREYMTTICRSCGSFKCNPSGDTRTAEIVTICKDCP